jgi:hypothetical protein
MHGAIAGALQLEAFGESAMAGSLSANVSTAPSLTSTLWPRREERHSLSTCSPAVYAARAVAAVTSDFCLTFKTTDETVSRMMNYPTIIYTTPKGKIP